MFDRRFVLAVAGGALFPPVFAAALLSLLQPYSRFGNPVVPVQLTFIQAPAATPMEPSTPTAEKATDVSFAAHAWSPPGERSADEGVVLTEKVEIARPIASSAEPPQPETPLDRETADIVPAQPEQIAAKNTAPPLTERPEESRELVSKEPQHIPPSPTAELDGPADPKTEQRAAETLVVASDQAPATQSRAVEVETVVEHVTSKPAPTGTSGNTPKMKAPPATLSSKPRRLVRKLIAKPSPRPPAQVTRKIATRKKVLEKVASARPAKKPKAIPILAKGGIEQGTWNSDQWTNWNSFQPYQF